MWIVLVEKRSMVVFMDFQNWLMFFRGMGFSHKTFPPAVFFLESSRESVL